MGAFNSRTLFSSLKVRHKNKRNKNNKTVKVEYGTVTVAKKTFTLPNKPQIVMV